jgi:signal transduction histidine kinase
MIAKIFYVAIAIGLIFNLVGDASVYRQNKVERETGEWLSNSYAVIQAIDWAKIEVLQSQNRKALTPAVRESFLALERLLKSTPNQNKRVADLLALNKNQIIAPKSNPALDILYEMSLAERTLLDERLKSNALSDSATADQMILTNVVDLAFMLIVVSFFFYEKKQAEKMQAAMTSALAHVESVNQSLLHSMSKKDSKFKMAVHDLKNPLGSIRGFAELLQDEEGNSLSTLEMVQIIKRISNNTLTLVESVLRTEEEEDDDPSAPKEQIQVLSCLEETCQFLEPIARNKKQSITIESLPQDFRYWASKQKMQDIFYNVISNALKYSPPSSVVLVSARNEIDQHIIEIKDQGPGFKKEDFGKMFLPGARLSAQPTGGESSSGIGLYSVKNALSRLNGRIEIKNNKDRGACVKIIFPKEIDAITSSSRDSAAAGLNSEILIDRL